MSWSNHEISDYIDDLPMKISSNYIPKHFNIEITKIPSIPDEDEYDFKFEKEAVSMAEAHEEEKRQEAEKFAQLRASLSSNILNQSENIVDNSNPQHQQQQDQVTNVPSILPLSSGISILSAVPINQISSDSKSSQTVTQSPTITSPPPLAPPVSVSLPPSGPVPLSGSMPGPMSGPMSGLSSLQYPLTSISNVAGNTATSLPVIPNNINNHLFQSVSSISVNSTYPTEPATVSDTSRVIDSVNSCISSSSSSGISRSHEDYVKMKCNSDVNNLSNARRNSVPQNLNTLQDNFGILQPIPSQFNCDTDFSKPTSNNFRQQQLQQYHHQQQQFQLQQHHFSHQSSQHNQFQYQQQQQQQQQFIPKNKIDPADFESSSSSPFDDALLRAIDDKQELNHVFQHY